LGRQKAAAAIYVDEKRCLRKAGPSAYIAPAMTRRWQSASKCKTDHPPQTTAVITAPAETKGATKIDERNTTVMVTAKIEWTIRYGRGHMCRFDTV